ncbi:caspase-8-like [Mixophyes fleayi]|uniref:caspase-8-like n=1 Tax=Mixophyes fleayi TaxID=3061075 RepID=UPI003F4DF1CA
MADRNCQLFNIIKQLETSEISEMYFLCKDLIPQRSQDDRKEGTELFNKLQEMGVLSNEDTSLIEELLYCLKRHDLLKKHFKVVKTMQGKLIISPYRYLLFDLGNLVPDRKLKEMKFLFTDKLSKAVLAKVTSLLDIFTELEKKDILGKDNLMYLKEISGNFDEDFLQKILEYENQNIVNVPDLESSIYNSQENTTSAVDRPEPSDQFYQMSSKKPGTCLIINNFKFAKAKLDMKDRHGTEQDKESLCNVFSKLGFQVCIEEDLKGNEIMSTVQSYRDWNHEKNDCFICCLLSHGNKGIIYGTDGQTVRIRDITNCFCSSLCPSLKGKPKLFFIQACQGKEHQKPVSVETDACKASSSSDESEKDLIPNEPDFLLGMATTLHYVSYRQKNYGSWYIQSLCTKLNENYQRNEDIHSILTKVNQDLSQKYANQFNGTQMPQPWTTLCKKLIFS